MATSIAEAKRSLAAKDRADEQARLRAEQERLDKIEDKQARDNRIAQARAERLEREARIRAEQCPYVPFEHRGRRVIVNLGHPDPALRQMAAFACHVLAHALATMNAQEVHTYATTGREMEAYDWPTRVIAQQLHEANRHGLLTVEVVA